jgi:Subtilase family
MIGPTLKQKIPTLRTVQLLAVAVLLVVPAFAQGQISDSATTQIAQLIAIKASLSPGEQKLSSNLVFASRRAQAKQLGAAASLINPNVADATGMVPVVVRGTVSPELLKDIAVRGGRVDAIAPSNDRVEAAVPLAQLEGLAGRSDVASIRERPHVRTNAGSLTTQGYVAHRAKQVVEGDQPVTGSGVKVGILSDSASVAGVAALKASGDLGPRTTVLAGQHGPANGSDEGTAMMEIVQDIAPNSQLFFATAFTSEASFANNIIALGDAGCSIVADDVSYSDEDPFQDSTIAQAVNKYVGTGGIYFSSAGNAGNLTNGNSSVWEGDFTDGGTLSSGPIFEAEGGPVVVHRFGGGQTSNQLLQPTSVIDLFWADRLGGSTNDFDLFVLDSAGTTVKGSSTNVQNGTQDAYEEIASTDLGGNYTNPAAGDRIVIIRKARSSVRAMHVEAFFGEVLAIGTRGATHGHNAGANTQSMAATFWNSAHTGTKPFNGTGNPTEPFSSDGPRKIFFKPNGAAISPGNFLFSTNGGTTLQKPDFSGADGVTTRTPGFNPFFGTSAASPHGAGIAALIRSANPSLTNTQIHEILVNTALDNMARGFDRDGGHGVLDAETAVSRALH